MSGTPKQWYEFRNAVFDRNFSLAQRLLKENPDLVHAKNGIGETALHFLAVENDREGVEWLLSKGADLNARNKFGIPLVFEVAQLEYKELFTWLVANGADPKVKDRLGQSISEFLADFDKQEMAEWVQQYCT